MALPDLDSLLKPISESSPCGDDLRYHPTTSQIKEACREEEELNQGVWKREVKTADYPLAIKVCRESLTKRGKDLEIVKYLTNALLKSDGLPGLKFGLDLALKLLETFWDDIHPQFEDEEDLDLRAAPLAWIGTKLDVAIRSLGVTKDGVAWYAYNRSLTVPNEEDAKNDHEAGKRRQEAIESGALSPEDFEISFRGTPAAFYEELQQQVADVQTSIDALATFCDEKFGEYSPSWSTLRDSLEEIATTARILHGKKSSPAASKPAAAKPAPQSSGDSWGSSGDSWGSSSSGDSWGSSDSSSGGDSWGESDSGESASESTEAPAATSDWGASSEPEAATGDSWGSSSSEPAAPAAAQSSGWGDSSSSGSSWGGGGGTVSAEPASEEDAGDRVAAAARFLRKTNGASPAPYLLIRGLRWGELRAAGHTPTFEQLPGPEPKVRVELKRLMAENDWQGLLEAAEEAAAHPSGRAWLDPQRYTLKALEALGADYKPVREAIRTELRMLLAEYPQLPKWSLADDTPAANRDTRDWLTESGLSNGVVQREEEPVEPAPPDAFELAQAAMKKGRAQEALGILWRELAVETSGRGRFLRKMQIVELCAASGHLPIAVPLLREIAEELESRRLDEWEGADVAGEAMALLYRLGEHIDWGDSERERIYGRICRMDPVRALTLRS